MVTETKCDLCGLANHKQELCRVQIWKPNQNSVRLGHKAEKHDLCKNCYEKTFQKRT